jgi:hypothetical protein
MISEPVRQLIARHIVSIEQLEILLLLREHRARSWTPAQVNDRLQSSLLSVTARLDDLAGRGLLHRDSDQFRYDATEELEAVVAALARDYCERRYSVIDLIFSKGSDRLKVFADAFKVKKKKGDPNG